MSKKPGKFEASWNKRAGIFYGPATGHPIQWNKDWNDLIGKEVNLFHFFLSPLQLSILSGATALMSMVQKSNAVCFHARALAGAFARSLSHIHIYTHTSLRHATIFRASSSLARSALRCQCMLMSA